MPLPNVAVPTGVAVAAVAAAADVVLGGICFAAAAAASPFAPSSCSVSGLGESSGSSGSEGCFVGFSGRRLEMPARRLSNCLDRVTAMRLSFSRDLKW